MYTPSHSIHTNADDATSSDDLQHAPAQEVSSMRCHTVGAGNTERDTSSMHHGAQGHGENRGEGSGHPGSGGVGGNAWKPLHRNAWLKQQVGALLQVCEKSDLALSCDVHVCDVFVCDVSYALCCFNSDHSSFSHTHITPSHHHSRVTYSTPTSRSSHSVW